MQNFVSNKRKRVKIWVFLVPIFLIFLSGGLIYSVSRLNFFKVKDFNVQGTNLISKEALLAEIAEGIKHQPKWRTWFGKDNILFWQFNKNTSFKSGSIASLAALEVKTDLIQKKVEIVAKDRELYAVWCVSGECYGIDETGIPFILVAEPQGVLILKIEDENQKEIKLGKPVFEKNEWFKNIKNAVETIKENNLPVKIIKIKDFRIEEWEAEIYLGFSVFFSLNFLPENFNNILKNLSKDLNFKKLNYLDFRVKNRIYYK